MCVCVCVCVCVDSVPNLSLVRVGVLCQTHTWWELVGTESLPVLALPTMFHCGCWIIARGQIVVTQQHGLLGAFQLYLFLFSDML